MKGFALLILVFSFSAFGETFDEIVSRMTDADPVVQAQKAQLSKVRAQHLSSLSTFIPRLSAEGTDTQTSDPFNSRSRQGLAMGRMNLFSSGADWAALNAADLAVKREEAALADVELEREFENAKILIGLIQSQQRQAVYRLLFSTNEELVKIVDARYTRGLTALQEVQKAAIERDNSMARLEDARRDEATGRAAAQAKLGEIALPQDWPWKSLLASDKAKGLVKRAADPGHQPKLVNAELSLQISRELKKESVRRFLPTLDLAVGYGYVDYQLVKEPSWVTTLNLVIPLFDLRNNGKHREAVAQSQVESANLDRARQDFDARIKASRSRFSIAVSSAQSREGNVSIANKLYEDNRRRLQQGRSSVNDVAVDQNRLAEAELLAVDGWANAHLEFIELCHALGYRYTKCI